MSAHTWTPCGTCPSCGAPLYHRYVRDGEDHHADHWEVQRACPSTCPHGPKTAAQ